MADVVARLSRDSKDHLSIAKNWDVWIVSCGDDLTARLGSAHAFDYRIDYEGMIEVILRLIYNKGDPAPNLPSLISRIFSGYGPNWGGLQTGWV